MDDINLLRTLVTVIAFAVYVGIVFWAYAPLRASRFDTAAQLPFADDDLPGVSQRSEQ
jgi:cytochrome c oxidase cbb3-type subunit IV